MIYRHKSSWEKHRLGVGKTGDFREGKRRESQRKNIISLIS
jgi:hypothetical protein